MARNRLRARNQHLRPLLFAQLDLDKRRRRELHRASQKVEVRLIRLDRRPRLGGWFDENGIILDLAVRRRTRRAEAARAAEPEPRVSSTTDGIGGHAELQHVQTRHQRQARKNLIQAGIPIAVTVEIDKCVEPAGNRRLDGQIGDAAGHKRRRKNHAVLVVRRHRGWTSSPKAAGSGCPSVSASTDRPR